MAGLRPQGLPVWEEAGPGQQNKGIERPLNQRLDRRGGGSEWGRAGGVKKNQGQGSPHRGALLGGRDPV